MIITKEIGGNAGKIMSDEKNDKELARLLGLPEVPIPREEADKATEKFFKNLEEEFSVLPPGVVEHYAQRMVDFLKGDISWGEILNLSPATIQRIAEFGHMQLQAGRLEDAERVFKVLTMLNGNNSAFHTMLGVVYQRQKRPGEALTHYDEAIKLNPNEGVALTNRGSLFLKHGKFVEARADFKTALEVPLAAGDEPQWHKQAKTLSKRLEELIKQHSAKGQEKAGSKKPSSKKE